MKTFNELHDLVIQWGKDKGILDNSTPVKQLLKTLEEVHELLTHLTTEPQDKDAIKDDLYDIVVTLILYCKMKQGGRFDFLKMWEYAETIKSVKKFYPIEEQGAEILYNLSQHLRQEIDEEATLWDTHLMIILSYVRSISHTIGVEPADGLQSVYDTISQRTGKMINGTFVKD